MSLVAGRLSQKGCTPAFEQIGWCIGFCLCPAMQYNEYRPAEQDQSMLGVKLLKMLSTYCKSSEN